MKPHERILVVDDDAAARDAMAALLRDEGYRVTTARDGLSAFEAIERDPPALVVTDVQMPRGDGYQLLKRLRATRATEHLPVLLVSALGQPARRVIGLDLGADDFLVKPVDPGELLARIRARLRCAHERAELEHRTMVDPLTGAMNRRGITLVLQREVARVARSGAPLSVLMVDVDHFKAINDQYGHPVGDTVLRHVSNALIEAVRAADHVGRCGGDEFLVLLADSDATAAELLAARLRELKIPLAIAETKELRVGVSIGVASFQAGDTPDELMERSDRAMYRKKRRTDPPLVA